MKTKTTSKKSEAVEEFKQDVLEGIDEELINDIKLRFRHIERRVYTPEFRHFLTQLKCHTNTDVRLLKKEWAIGKKVLGYAKGKSKLSFLSSLCTCIQILIDDEEILQLFDKTENELHGMEVT